ncbi:MAG: hypothetical protein KGI70_03075 [Patescibacteria group bacterium]|nr:hypothetical protein [Patescibacteria group bacterium]
MYVDPYALSPENLLVIYRQALTEARAATTEKAAITLWQYSSLLANAIAARMRGFNNPPIRPNDEVKQAKSDWSANASSIRLMALEGKETAVVARVWCDEEGTWSLGFAHLPFDMTIDARHFAPISRVYETS